MSRNILIGAAALVVGLVATVLCLFVIGYALTWAAQGLSWLHAQIFDIFVRLGVSDTHPTRGMGSNAGALAFIATILLLIGGVVGMVMFFNPIRDEVESIERRRITRQRQAEEKLRQGLEVSPSEETR